MGLHLNGTFTPLRKGKERERNRRDGKRMSHAFSFLDLGRSAKAILYSSFL
jgi:hypothetical protein